MKIVNDDVTLRLVDNRRLFGLPFCLLWAALAVAVGIYEVAAYKHEVTAKYILNAVLFFAVFSSFPWALNLLAWVRRDFQFDKNSRVLTWQRRTLFTKKGGTVPFSTIQDVAVEAITTDSASHSGATITQHHLVLNTTQGKLEVNAAKTLSLATVQKQCAEAIARIREALGKSRA